MIYNFARGASNARAITNRCCDHWHRSAASVARPLRREIFVQQGIATLEFRKFDCPGSSSTIYALTYQCLAAPLSRTDRYRARSKAGSGRCLLNRINGMMALPPNHVKVRLHHISPSALCAPHPESEYSVILFQTKLEPAFLRFIDQLADLMTVMHFVRRARGKLIDLPPSETGKMLKRGMNFTLPFLIGPCARLKP